MRNRLPAALLMCLLLLNGCGQKGPLYLPEPEQATQPVEPLQPEQPTDEPETKKN
jgi:predicted small lipoprotein YifL